MLLFTPISAQVVPSLAIFDVLPPIEVLIEYPGVAHSGS